MISADLIIDKMLVIDDTGMPVAPTIRQLMDKDIKQLYTRDKTKDKSNYIVSNDDIKSNQHNNKNSFFR